MSIINQFSDQEVFEKLKQNDVSAFKEIYKYYWYKLYIVAYKRISSREAAEEIVQNIFTKLWINRAQLNIKGPLGPYLFTSVRYGVIDHMEREATRRNYETLAYYNDEALDYSTEDYVDLHDLENYLQEAVERLPSKCKSVFVMSRKEYKSNREISLILGISEKTVENHITNALKVIRAGLKKVAAIVLVCYFFLLIL